VTEPYGQGFVAVTTLGREKPMSKCMSKACQEPAGQQKFETQVGPPPPFLPADIAALGGLFTQRIP
jgi:hypothetical protein